MWRARSREALGRYSRSELVRQAAGSSLARVIGLGAGFVSSVIVARALGPAGRGQLAVAATAIALGAQLGHFGLPAANTHAVAKDRSVAAGMFANSLVVSLGAGVTLALGAVILATAAPSWLPIRGSALVLVAVLFPLTLAFAFVQSLALGLQRVWHANAFDLANRVGYLVLVAGAAAALDLRVSHVLGAMVAALVPTLVTGMGWLHTRVVGAVRPSMTLLRANLGYGLRTYLISTFALLLLRVDVLIVQAERGAADAGRYSIAVSVVEIVYLVPAATGTVLFPRLSAEPSDLRRWLVAKRAMWWMAGACAAAAAILALVAPMLIGGVFGAQFDPAVGPLRLLCIAVVPIAANTIMTNYIASIGSPRSAVLIWATAALANVGLNLALVPRLGVNGAALSSVATYTLVLVLQLGFVRKPLDARTPSADIDLMADASRIR